MSILANRQRPNCVRRSDDAIACSTSLTMSSPRHGFGKNTHLTKNIIYGLGGRDINTEQILDVIRSLKKAADAGKVSEEAEYVGLRE